MKILTAWLRAYLPSIPVSDRQLAEDLTLRGVAVEGVHDLGRSPDGTSLGHMFEMDITTNRVDAMNHYGIAREAATIYELELPGVARDLELSVLARDLPVAASRGAFPVRIAAEAQGLCGRFTARVLRDVRIGPSTGRVAEFFHLLGQRSISNAVDASNFTLLGMGHPTHAFDLDRIEGGIVVRLARRGEMLRLLDGTTRTLEPDDLVIADERRALSLAGVMGGMDSSITAATRNVLVESAWFDPATIRRSSRRHLLHTDASHRFERGADFSAAPLANDLVAKLIVASGGGTVQGELVDVMDAAIEARTAARPPVLLRVEEVRRHLGATIDDRAEVSALTPDLMRRYLTALGCTLSGAGVDEFSVRLPSWRLDLEREVDLIEEVARVFGYNRFANTLPTPLPVRARPSAAAERAVRARLLALGFTESISSTFASVADAAHFGVPEGGAARNEAAARYAVAMENPLSEEASLLRPSLVPGMLTAIAGNLHRDVREVRLFEQGHTFAAMVPAGSEIVGDVTEVPRLALGLTSASTQSTSLVSAEDAPIYELKGAIESLAGMFALPGGAASLRFEAAGLPAWIEEGRGGVAHLHGEPLAVFGELAGAEATRRKLRQPVYLASIAIADLLELPLREFTARELSRFQAVERDFSFVFPDRTEWHTVAAAIDALALPDLERLAPVEIFRDAKGKAIPVGEHSLLLRVTFQSATRTLTETDLAEASARVIAALTELGGTHRA